MFLGAYRFDGDPATLVSAYDRLAAAYPPDTMLLHVCVLRTDGITVLDACPSEDDFVAFAGSADFRAAVHAAGLPEPAVERLGPIHAAHAPALTAP